ncbi:MAG: Sec-independent protein translocase TatA [Ponticaulis sp.]|nr:Sec-independent protein translocase TatA [Ponticaulis sp.]|tara:strand:+ start:545 stop:742 length:198 start_codon:yes stop_codon:yes gene_type:complete
MAPGWMQLLLVAVVALLLFGGRGKISSIMGDMAKGIKSFRTGLKDDEDDEKSPEPINVTPEKDKV